MFDGSGSDNYPSDDDDEASWAHRFMRDEMEADYEARYRPEFSRMRPWRCRCVRNRMHPGKKKPRREYLMSGKWYPVESLPEELVEAIEKERAGMEVTSDEDALSDEEPAVDPRPDPRELARREAERKRKEKRAKREAAKWNKEWQILESKRQEEEARAEQARRAALTEEERAAEDEHERVWDAAGSYHLDPQEAHEAAVKSGNAAHVAADDEFYSWTIPELKQLLEANDQLKGGTKPVLVARCADGKLYGGLPRCPQCGGGKLKVTYHGASGHGASGHGGRGWFRCPGYYDDDEYVNCSFVGLDVQRTEWKQEDADADAVPACESADSVEVRKRAKVAAATAPVKTAVKAAAKVAASKAAPQSTPAMKTANTPRAAAEKAEKEVADSLRRSAASRVRIAKTLVRWTYSAGRRRFSTSSGELRMVPVQLVTTGEGAIVEFEGGKFAKLGSPAPGQLPLVSLD